MEPKQKQHKDKHNQKEKSKQNQKEKEEQVLPCERPYSTLLLLAKNNASLGTIVDECQSHLLHLLATATATHEGQHELASCSCVSSAEERAPLEELRDSLTVLQRDLTSSLRRICSLLHIDPDTDDVLQMPMRVNKDPMFIGCRLQQNHQLSAEVTFGQVCDAKEQLLSLVQQLEQLAASTRQSRGQGYTRLSEGRNSIQNGKSHSPEQIHFMDIEHILPTKEAIENRRFHIARIIVTPICSSKGLSFVFSLHSIEKMSFLYSNYTYKWQNWQI